MTATEKSEAAPRAEESWNAEVKEDFAASWKLIEEPGHAFPGRALIVASPEVTLSCKDFDDESDWYEAVLPDDHNTLEFVPPGVVATGFLNVGLKVGGRIDPYRIQPAGIVEGKRRIKCRFLGSERPEPWLAEEEGKG